MIQVQACQDLRPILTERLISVVGIHHTWHEYLLNKGYKYHWQTSSVKLCWKKIRNIHSKQSTSSEAAPTVISFPELCSQGRGVGGSSGHWRIATQVSVFHVLRQVPSSSYLELQVGKQAIRLIFCPLYFSSAVRCYGIDFWRCAGEALMCWRKLSVMMDGLLIPLSERGVWGAWQRRQ